MKTTKEEMKRTVKPVTAEDLLKRALEAWARENYHNDPNTVMGEDGLLNRLKKQLIETMLEGEIVMRP